ncbi:MAG: alpha/beta hydrolase [Thermomicrobiales bacterium]
MPAPWEWPPGAAESSTIRGLRWPGSRTPVLLIHEPARDCDLDSWGPLPEILQRAGHSVVAFDLPGHGLSEGNATKDAAAEAIDRAWRVTGAQEERPIAVVAAGPACSLVPLAEMSALVLLSPVDESHADTGDPKLVLVGALDPVARAAADRFLRASRGWTLVSSFATVDQGTSLLATTHANKIAMQIVSFLRDYS